MPSEDLNVIINKKIVAMRAELTGVFTEVRALIGIEEEQEASPSVPKNNNPT